jgi:predicted GNAT family N-acyltransferase
MLHPVDENTLKLRQMAVADEWQKNGIGKLLVRNAEELARQKGYKEMVLHARITAQDFYRGLGYEPSGEVFTEVTIPHIFMKKAL